MDRTSTGSFCTEDKDLEQSLMAPSPGSLLKAAMLSPKWRRGDPPEVPPCQGGTAILHPPSSSGDRNTSSPLDKGELHGGAFLRAPCTPKVPPWTRGAAMLHSPLDKGGLQGGASRR